MITLGNRAKDKITDFMGILTGKCEYLYGCTQWCIMPPVKLDGSLPDGKWFDEGRIEFIDTGILPASVQVDKPGADQYNMPEAR